MTTPISESAHVGMTTGICVPFLEIWRDPSENHGGRILSPPGKSLGKPRLLKPFTSDDPSVFGIRNRLLSRKKKGMFFLREQILPADRALRREKYCIGCANTFSVCNNLLKNVDREECGSFAFAFKGRSSAGRPWRQSLPFRSGFPAENGAAGSVKKHCPGQQENGRSENMTISECYEKLGGDYADVCTRLPSDRLVAKFIGRFLEDDSFH